MAQTVLVIEDEPDTNDLLAELLGRRGFQPIQAYTGKAGLSLAQERHPDLILLDLMLPDVHGFEICETLRTTRATNLIPIVMVTALAESEHRVHGFRVGATSYVVKPFTSAQLFGALDSALKWKTQIVEGQVQGEISFDVASETGYLVEVNDLLSSLFLLTPLDEKSVKQLRQALLEMGQNAIEWGNRNQLEKAVKITYRLHPDRITLTVRDQGPGFDPHNVPHAATEQDPVAHMSIREVLGLRDGGFGILITRGLVDELQYNEAGNEVTLIKRFPPNRR
jgi:DNA-binding response OmpR family regulator